MRNWIKAALAAAATAWLLMCGMDYLETHMRTMKWVQMDMIDRHQAFHKALKGE